MSRTSTRDRIGQRIGDYRIESELHREETGVVYLGAHLLLPRRAAVKVMHEGQAWLRAVAMQVLREACILEALSHPGIPRVYECGMLDDRRPWSAFEYVEGTPIGAPMPIAELVTLLRDAAEILAHAHGRGVTHGAISRTAIARTPDARFPIRLLAWANASTLDTEARTPIDPGVDIRMLGELAFEVLTGARFVALTSAEACPSAPVELTALIDRMLSGTRPTAVEIHQQTSWLATTLELLPAKQRWTPPRGLDDKAAEAPDFQIRISRTTSSS